MTWQKGGDNSTPYYLKAIKERRAKKAFLSIYESQGNKLEDVKLIGDACVKYYEDIRYLE